MGRKLTEDEFAERDAQTQAAVDAHKAKRRRAKTERDANRYLLFCKGCRRQFRDYRKLGYVVRPKYCLDCNPNGISLAARRRAARKHRAKALEAAAKGEKCGKRGGGGTGAPGNAAGAPKTPGGGVEPGEA